MVTGAVHLRRLGYSEAQIAGLPPSAFVYRKGGAWAIGGVPSRAFVPQEIRGKWVGGVGGRFEVFEPGYAKTRFAEGVVETGPRAGQPREVEVVLPEAPPGYVREYTPGEAEVRFVPAPGEERVVEVPIAAAAERVAPVAPVPSERLRTIFQKRAPPIPPTYKPLTIQAEKAEARRVIAAEDPIRFYAFQRESEKIATEGRMLSSYQERPGEAPGGVAGFNIGVEAYEKNVEAYKKEYPRLSRAAEAVAGESVSVRQFGVPEVSPLTAPSIDVRRMIAPGEAGTPAQIRAAARQSLEWTGMGIGAAAAFPAAVAAFAGGATGAGVGGALTFGAGVAGFTAGSVAFKEVSERHVVPWAAPEIKEFFPSHEEWLYTPSEFITGGFQLGGGILTGYAASKLTAGAITFASKRFKGVGEAGALGGGKRAKNELEAMQRDIRKIGQTKPISKQMTFKQFKRRVKIIEGVGAPSPGKRLSKDLGYISMEPRPSKASRFLELKATEKGLGSVGKLKPISKQLDYGKFRVQIEKVSGKGDVIKRTPEDYLRVALARDTKRIVSIPSKAWGTKKVTKLSVPVFETLPAGKERLYFTVSKQLPSHKELLLYRQPPTIPASTKLKLGKDVGKILFKSPGYEKQLPGAEKWKPFSIPKGDRGFAPFDIKSLYKDVGISETVLIQIPKTKTIITVPTPTGETTGLTAFKPTTAQMSLAQFAKALDGQKTVSPPPSTIYFLPESYSGLATSLKITGPKKELTLKELSVPKEFRSFIPSKETSKFKELIPSEKIRPEFKQVLTKGPALQDYVGAARIEFKQFAREYQTVTPKQKYLSAQAEKAIQKSISKQLSITTPKTKVAQKTMMTQLQLQMQKQLPMQKQLQMQKQLPMQRQLQLQRQLQTQLQLQIQKQTMKFKIGEIQELRQTMPTGFKIPFFFPLVKKRAPLFKPAKRPLPGFEVLVKKAGAWAKVSPFPLTRMTALGLGAIKTETAARTFLLRPSKRPGRRIPSLERLWRPERFRAPKGKSLLPRGAFVEKAKFAIDFPKEFEEITLKARKGVRRKKKTKKRKRRYKK